MAGKNLQALQAHGNLTVQTQSQNESEVHIICAAKIVDLRVQCTYLG